MTDTHRDTIMRLMVEVGTGCASSPMNKCATSIAAEFNATKSGRFAGQAGAHPRFTERTKIGDQWTFVAIDPDTKLVPAYRVGKRTRTTPWPL